VSFNCPYCSFKIVVKTPKPGKFQPKCPKCHKHFQLSIPDNINGEWRVTPLLGPNGESVEATQITGPHQPPELPGSTAKPTLESTHLQAPRPIDERNPKTKLPTTVMLPKSPIPQDSSQEITGGFSPVKPLVEDDSNQPTGPLPKPSKKSDSTEPTPLEKTTPSPKVEGTKLQPTHISESESNPEPTPEEEESSSDDSQPSKKKR
jgi:eukaryotic-like serine/threonine-protein kinase